MNDDDQHRLDLDAEREIGRRWAEQFLGLDRPFRLPEPEPSLIERIIRGGRSNMPIRNKPTPATRPSRLAQTLDQAEKLRRKLARTEAYAEMLRTIPEQDPWSDGTVLEVTSDSGYSYLLFRIDGRWYATGNTNLGAPDRLAWPELVDWLVKSGVRFAYEYVRSSRVNLAGDLLDEPDAENDPQAPPAGKAVPMIQFPVMTCDYTTEEDHAPHAWEALGSRVWCPGR